MHDRAVKGVDIDRHRLAGTHMRQLRLHVIRGDVDGVQRHDRHQLRTWLNKLADLQRAHAYRSVERRGDRRVVQVELGLMLVRLLLRQGRARLLELPLKNGDLLLGAGDPRFVAVELRLFLDDIGLSLLGALHRAVAGAFQIRVALEVLLRIDERCLIRCHLLTSLFDREALQRDLLR